MSERTPSSDRLRRMASDYEKAVSEARSEQLAARAVARARSSQSRRRRFSAVLAGVSLLLVTVVALGVTSANSLPGDPLYGVSRAYEEVGGWVGVVDPVEQRLYEVIALAERGDGVLAGQAAEEALAELERTTDLQLALPPATTTTTPDAGGGTVTQETTPTTAPHTVSVEASPGVDEDPINTLKLAAELLLNSVKENGGELAVAAAVLAEAVSGLAAEDPDVTAGATSTTTSSTSSTTTSTTEPESSTTTTVPDSTTTTVPEGRGPIFLPPQP